MNSEMKDQIRVILGHLKALAEISGKGSISFSVPEGHETIQFNYEKHGTTIGYTSDYVRMDPKNPKKILESTVSEGITPDEFLDEMAKWMILSKVKSNQAVSRSTRSPKVEKKEKKKALTKGEVEDKQIRTMLFKDTKRSESARKRILPTRTFGEDEEDEEVFIQEVTIIRNNRTWQYEVKKRKEPIKVKMTRKRSSMVVYKPNGFRNEFPEEIELDDITYYLDRFLEEDSETSRTYNTYYGFYVV